MGFNHATDLRKTVEMAHDSRPEAKVNILAAGGIVLPLVEEDVDLFST